jgi:hypothetical protein
MECFCFANQSRWTYPGVPTSQCIHLLFFTPNAKRSRINTVWRMTSLPVPTSHSLRMTSVSARLRPLFICETKSHYLTRIRFLCQLFRQFCTTLKSSVLSCAISVYRRRGKVPRIFLKQTLGVEWGVEGVVNVYVSEGSVQSGALRRKATGWLRVSREMRSATKRTTLTVKNKARRTSEVTDRAPSLETNGGGMIR